MKKRNYLFLLGCIFILLISINWRNINSFLADKSISWFDNVVDRQETITFRYNRIDSLYEKKDYKYYLFMKEALKNDCGIIQTLPYDSVLAIKPHSFCPHLIKEHPDTISLPASAIELVVKKDEEMALFQILSVQKDSVGYLYRLKRICVTK